MDLLAFYERVTYVINYIYSQEENNSEEYMAAKKISGKEYDKDVIDKLGEPYISKNTVGMGLGIFISKNLIENMGGKLDLYNSKDENAVVEITFDNSILNI